MTVKGIDVSSVQGAGVKTSGQDFVFIKATEGTSYINPDQAAQAASARKAGAIVGFYHFLWPGNIQAQAEYFVAKCASVESDLLCVDWETTGSGTHASGAEKDQFIKAVKKLRPTHRVLLYCNVSDWKTRDTTSYAGDGLWVAQYGVTAGKPGITAPWKFHQYTSSPIDTSVGQFANKAALKAWAAGSTTPPTPPTPPKVDSPVANMTTAQMAANYGAIDTIPYADEAVETHAGGYYLAHLFYDTQQLWHGVVALSAKLDAIQAQLDALKAGNE